MQQASEEVAVLVRFSIAVIKYHDQKQLRDKRAYFSL